MEISKLLPVFLLAALLAGCVGQEHKESKETVVPSFRECPHGVRLGDVLSAIPCPDRRARRHF